MDPAMLRPWITLAVNADISADAAKLTMPVLTVVAPHTWEPGESWAACAESLGYGHVPHLTGLRIDDCGHFVMLDHPRTLANAVRRFARRSDAPVLAARQGWAGPDASGCTLRAD
ncbi:MAG: alpha/beta hydrolase, partial [Candidatus Eisenbacteria bacterium]